MKITESERRLINRWKRSEQRWPRLRWIAISTGGTLTVFYVLALCWFHAWVFQDVADESGTARIGVLAGVSPVLWMGLLFSAAWFGISLVQWNGNAKRRLFLKLLSDHENTDA